MSRRNAVGENPIAYLVLRKERVGGVYHWRFVQKYPAFPLVNVTGLRFFILIHVVWIIR